ncbi:MAG: hypothetical protein LBI60_04500 [Bacteroidales bacterium]|nr:hypothetical protein [Bacteroidales bacterium]
MLHILVVPVRRIGHYAIELHVGKLFSQVKEVIAEKFRVAIEMVDVLAPKLAVIDLFAFMPEIIFIVPIKPVYCPDKDASTCGGLEYRLCAWRNIGANPIGYFLRRLVKLVFLDVLLVHQVPPILEFANLNKGGNLWNLI